MAEKIIFAITIVLLKTFVLSQRHSTLVRADSKQNDLIRQKQPIPSHRNGKTTIL